MTGHAGGDHKVHEAIGPDLSGVQAGAAIFVGVISLLYAGVIPVLLGSLADEHRISASGIGLTATLEALCMGMTTFAMGMIRRPRRVKLIAALAVLALAGLNVLVTQTSGVMLMAVRGAAGGVEGVMLWVAVAMISRTVTPERWAGIFFTSQTLAQAALAFGLERIVPAWGANGGYLVLAAATLLGLFGAALAPDLFAPLAENARSELPPPRGWLALAVTLVWVSASAAASIYVQPLAEQGGLSGDIVRKAAWISLIAQVAGGATATLLAGRLRYLTVFGAASAIYLVVWWLFGRAMTPWIYIGAMVTWGFAGMLLAPFIVPMTIDADPSRRAAVQSGAAQLVGGALGPLLASFVVTEGQARRVLVLAAALLISGLAGVIWLRATHREGEGESA